MSEKSEKPGSIQDGFVLPSEGPIADRPHRAYDVEVDGDTYKWLQQTPDSARVPFVPLGNIPKKAVGYLTRGDGPKAVLGIQDGIRTKLPRAIGIPEGKTLRSSPSDEDVDRTFDPETIVRREVIATRVVDFVCEKFLELQGDDLDKFVKEGLKLTVPKELVADVGFDATFVPHLGKGIANGWVPNSQDVGSRRRDGWLSNLSESVYTRVRQFVADKLQIQKGALATDTKNCEHPWRRMQHISKLTPDILDKLCRIECNCNGSDSFTVSISFSPRNLDHLVFSPYEPILGPSRGAQQHTETKWTTPPSGATWKQKLEKAA
ncbi:MAG: hypothetical protein WC604_03765 [Candidatus Gracilibacteria bacterium]